MAILFQFETQKLLLLTCLKFILARKAETRRSRVRNITATDAQRERAASRVGVNRDQDNEASDEADNQPNPPCDARRAERLQDRSVGFRRLERLFEKTSFVLGRLHVFEHSEVDIIRGIRRLRLGLDKRIKNFERRVLEVILFRSALCRQRRLDISARNRCLLVVLQEVIRLKETLVERNVLRHHDSCDTLHLLYLTSLRPIMSIFLKRLLGALARSKIAMNLEFPKVAAADARFRLSV